MNKIKTVKRGFQKLKRKKKKRNNTTKPTKP